MNNIYLEINNISKHQNYLKLMNEDYINVYPTIDLLNSDTESSPLMSQESPVMSSIQMFVNSTLKKQPRPNRKIGLKRLNIDIDDIINSEFTIPKNDTLNYKSPLSKQSKVAIQQVREPVISISRLDRQEKRDIKIKERSNRSLGHQTLKIKEYPLNYQDLASSLKSFNVVEDRIQAKFQEIKRKYKDGVQNSIVKMSQRSQESAEIFIPSHDLFRN